MFAFKPIICFCAVVISVAAHAQQNEKTLTLLAEEKAPHVIYDAETGDFGGQEVELVVSLLDAAGIDYSFVLTPRKRALRRAGVDRNVCLLAINHTPERDHLFQWVSPTQIGGWAIYQRPDNDIALTSLNDMAGYRVVGRLGSQATDEIEANINKPVFRAADTDAGVRILYRKRADLLVVGVNDVAAATERLGLPPLKKAFDWKPAFFGLACSKDTDFDIIVRLRRANTARLAMLQ